MILASLDGIVQTYGVHDMADVSVLGCYVYSVAHVFAPARPPPTRTRRPQSHARQRHIVSPVSS
jgi:hypothetical protein